MSRGRAAWTLAAAALLGACASDDAGPMMTTTTAGDGALPDGGLGAPSTGRSPSVTAGTGTSGGLTGTGTTATATTTTGAATGGAIVTTTGGATGGSTGLSGFTSGGLSGFTSGGLSGFTSGASGFGSSGFTTGGAGTTAGTGTTTGDGGGTSTGSTGSAGPVMTSMDPIIPEVTGDCPNFATGSFSFSGISGEMEAGDMSAGPGPMLFYWHGTGGRAGSFGGAFGGIGRGNVSKIISQGGIIFAVQGSTGAGDASCSGTAVFDGDFSVIDQVVACAVRDHNIDPRRIYSTGCSAGGLQSGCMAVRRNDYVAAVAPNSGGLVGAFGASFRGTTGHVPNTFSMHGGSGDNVIINFGESSSTFNGLVSGAGGLAIDCNHMSGHCGAPSALYDLAIDFLLAHPFGVDPIPWSMSPPANLPDYCQIVQ